MPIAWVNARAAGFEQRLCNDATFRVIDANQQPDHATVARFRRHHQDAIADVSAGSSMTRRQIVDEILDEAEAVIALSVNREGTTVVAGPSGSQEP